MPHPKPRQPGKPWSEEELEILAKAYRAGGWRGAVKAFAGTRTKHAVQTRAIALGQVSQQRWTQEDISALRRMAAERRSCRAIAVALGRTEKAVQLEARRLGMAPWRSRPDARPVAPGDLQALKRAATTPRGISQEATRRGIDYTTASNLVREVMGPRRQVFPWTASEKSFLRQHYAGKPVEWIVENMPTPGDRRSVSSVRIMASTLGLTAGRREAALRGVDEKRAREAEGE